MPIRVARVLALALFFVTVPALAETTQPLHAGDPPAAQVTTVLDLLERSGHPYVKVAPNVWGVDFQGSQGKIRVLVSQAEGMAVFLCKIDGRENLTLDSRALMTLLRFNDHADIAKVSIDEQYVWVRADSHLRVLDIEEFDYLLRQVAALSEKVVSYFVTLRKTALT